MFIVAADTLKLEWVEAPEPAEVRFRRLICNALSLKTIYTLAEIAPDSLSARIIHAELNGSRTSLAARARLAVIGDYQLVGY